MHRPLIFIFPLALPLAALAQNSVSIHVLDPGQKPVKDAVVTYRVWGEKKYRFGTLHTDATGTATLSLEKPINPEQPSGSVVVHAKGFAIDGANIKSKSLGFKLKPGAKWRGLVVDGAGKPIAGATVKVGSMRSKEMERDDFLVVDGEEMSASYTTISADDGTFQLDDFPVGGTVGYDISKPGFATTGPDRQMPIADVARMVLPPEAKFHGKLLGIDGQPLAGVRIYASAVEIGQGFGEDKTAIDGTFTIGALPAGQYNVGISQPEGTTYVVPSLTNVLAETAKTVELKPLRALGAIQVTGVVRDKATGKPLAGVGITATQPEARNFASDSHSKLTDEDGKFTVRVLPGRTRFYVNQAPPGFLGDEEGQTVTIDTKAPASLTIQLQPAPLLTGTIVDENNRPIKAQLRLQESWERTTITSDAQGKWHWRATLLGTVSISGGGDDSGYFELLSNREWKVPASGPLTIRVRKHPWQKLEGRIVSRDGKPLPGIEVKSTYYINLGDGGSLDEISRTATTDVQGYYLFPRIHAPADMSKLTSNLKVGASGKGMAYVSGGTISHKGNAWQVNDIVLASLNRRIEGQTAAGARVIAANQETTADATGHFVFEGLPEGETPVFAAIDGKFGSAISRDSTTPLNIELAAVQPQGVDMEMGRATWRELIREDTNSDFFAREWVNNQLKAMANPNSESFESLKRTDNGPTTTNGDWSLAGQLAKWAPKLPTENRVARLEEVANGINRPEIRLCAWLDSAIQSNDLNVAKRALQEADATLLLTPPEFSWREYNLYRLAVVAEKVGGSKAGENALNNAIKWTFAHNPEKPFRENGREVDPSRDTMLKIEAKTVAQGSEDLLRQLLTAIDPESGKNIEAIADAIPSVARTHGIEVALPLLEELVNMPKPGPDEQGRRASVDPQFSFNQTALQLIKPLADKSPQRALELARRITDSTDRARAVAIATPYQPREEAAQLWRETILNAELDQVARIAAQAWQSDPNLGVELFGIARQRFQVMRNDPESGRISGHVRAWPAYGFYFALVDPAVARLELERQWTLMHQKTDVDGGDLSYIALAMTAIDGKRALEMARSIPKGKDNFWSLEARMKIGQYLVASTEKRRNLSFNNWSSTSTWQPGDEER